MTSYGDKLEKLHEILGDKAIMMVTTLHGDKMLSRPMGLQKMEFDGTLWFFTSIETEKVEEIRQDNRVNASFADNDRSSYASISGRCEILRDTAKATELWTPFAKTWFDGPEDPKLVLMRVTPESAEYWDAPNSKMVRIFQMVAGAITGKEMLEAENERVDIR